MANQGRLKQTLDNFVAQSIPGVDYLASYPGTIISQSGQAFDFNPDSSIMPGLQGLSFYGGHPGITITIDPAQNPRAVLFFAGGDPRLPSLCLGGSAGLLALTITAEESIQLSAPSVQLGSSPTDFLVRGTTYRAAEDVLFAALNTELAAAGSALASAGAAATFTLAAPFLATAGSSLAALAASFTGFTAAKLTYLSTVSQTE
jgi:hypothetical protein